MMSEVFIGKVGSAGILLPTNISGIRISPLPPLSAPPRPVHLAPRTAVGTNRGITLFLK